MQRKMGTNSTGKRQLAAIGGAGAHATAPQLPQLPQAFLQRRTSITKRGAEDEEDTPRAAPRQVNLRRPRNETTADEADQTKINQRKKAKPSKTGSKVSHDGGYSINCY